MRLRIYPISTFPTPSRLFWCRTISIPTKRHHCMKPSRPPRRGGFLHRHRSPRFLNQLLGGFVEADQGTIRIVWPGVNGQHVLHGGDECAVLFRRDDPLFLEVRLDGVFLKPARSCCRLHDSQCRVPRPGAPAAARSNARVPSGVWSTPVRSVELPSHRQKFAAPKAAPVACGSERPQSPPQPVVGVSDTPL